MHSFVWSAGVLTDLGQIFGADFNYASGIDNTYRIVGTADLAGNLFAHGYLLQNGTFQDLQPLSGQQVSWAMGMNNRGEVVGGSGFQDPFQEEGPPVYA